MTFQCIKCKIHKYTITEIRKYTNTKCLKDPTCAIFLKSIGFKDIKYDIPVCQIHYIYKDIYKDIHILTERPVVLLNAIFYEESRWAEAYIGCWKFQLAQIYN